MSRKNFITVYTQGGKFSGRVEGDTFHRTFQENHILRFPRPALAMDVSVVDQLKAQGVTRLEFRHKDTGAVYRASLAHFLEAAYPLDRGYGAQLALPLAGWTVTGRGVQSRGEMPSKPKPEQLSLFGGVR